jgi:lysophospholipase L1-like esterase
MPRCVRRLAAPALAVVGVAAVLAAAELFLRATAPDTHAPGLRPRDPPDDAAPVLTKLAEIYNQKHVRGWWRGVFVRTNSRTLRGPEYASRPAPGVFRIAIGGDSVTMGLGVDEADTYPAQLERLLAEDGRGPPVEVINAGLSGINVNYAVSRLSDVARHYHPQLLVLGFTSNDIEGRYYRPLATGEADAALEAARMRFADAPSHLLRALWPRGVSLREQLWPTPGTYVQELAYNYFENPQAWQNLRNGLERLARLTRGRGVCGHVLIHTSLGELGWLHPERRIYAAVEAAAREFGLGVTQSFPQFRGSHAPSLWVNAYDHHPNALGNALLARALRDGLRTLPEACWDLGNGRGPIQGMR